MKLRSLLLYIIFSSPIFTQAQLVKYVDPMIGTGGHGHTFPGATSPFGMVQLSPDTRLTGWDGCSGYHHSDSLVFGFSHTHLSGTGCSDYGDILLMPFTGSIINPVNANGMSAYASVFSKKEERVTPGYYAVRLKSGVEAELTATPRVGIHQYKYKGNKGVFIDLAHRDEVIESKLTKVSSTTIEGYRVSRAWARKQRIYFVIRFSEPIKVMQWFLNNKKATIDSSVEGKDIKAALLFDDKSKKSLKVEVGISATGVEGARKNMAAETKIGKSFNDYVTECRQRWEYELSRVQINSVDSLAKQAFWKSNLRKFYTALYHCMVQPNVFSDVDGLYRGMDDRNHQSTDGDVYSVFSLWDTFRAYHPLMSILDPKRTLQFVRTFLHHYSDGGLLPVWELAANETFCMIGYHAVPVILDAYRKGIRDFDTILALKAMVNSADLDHYGLKAYKKFGYIPASEEGESVSKTLEYAYDDWCIASYAELIGDTETAARFYKRAQSYKNLYDSKSGFFRAKNKQAWLKR
jgi:predicted alpha-1,2-mannosidase